jgi:hypothetical protein
MKIRFQFILVAVFAWANAPACDCKSRTLAENQKSELNDSKLVFIADVISSDSAKGTYELRVVELFKGHTKETTITGNPQTSCSGFARIGRWLVYAEVFDGKSIDFNICGLSRSFDNPQFANASEYYPAGPLREEVDPKRSIHQQIEFEKEMLRIKLRALSDLEIEIEHLRKNRR